MDGLLLLVGLFALTIVAGSILGLVSFGRTSTLLARVTRLEQELANLRQTRGADASAAAPVSTPEPAELAVAEPPVEGGAAREEMAPPPSAEDLLSVPSTDETPAAEEPSPPQEPLPPRKSLEEALGTRWTVWIGGLALGLGGIFLVRYSIEAGLLGPAARLALGMVFALCLLAAGEWLRRSGLAETDHAADRNAYVPGILTAAGTVAAFADVYAAHGLYDFIGSATAFVALGLVGLATMSLALLHGPTLAALGLAGSYATPFLVASNQPALGALATYLTIVSAATLALARLRGWRWLAFTAVIGATAWAVLMEIMGNTPYEQAVLSAYLAAALALTALTFIGGIHDRDRTQDAPHDRGAVIALSVFALPVVFFVSLFDASDLAPWLIGAFALALLTLALEWPALRALAATAGAATLIAYASLATPIRTWVTDPSDGSLVPPALSDLINSPGGERLLGIGLVLALIHACLALLGSIASRGRAWLAGAGAAVPLGLLAIAYVRTEGFAVSPAFAWTALVLAIYFSVVTERLDRRLDPVAPSRNGAVALHAIGAIAAIGAAAAFVLEKGALTIVLSLLVPATAWVESRRPFKGLRAMACVVSLVVMARVADDPRIVGDDLGTTPLFNWLLYGYGVPALAFSFAAWRFARTEDDRRWVPWFEALGVVFGTLTIVMQIHHYMNGGRMFGGVSGVAEQSLLTMSMLAVSFGLHWLNIRRNSPIFGQGSLIAGGIGLAGSAVGLLVLQNPLLTGQSIDGGAFDGTLLLGYLFPALMLFMAARLAAKRVDNPRWYVAAAGALGGILAFAWVTLAVRAGWHGGDLSLDTIDEGELYAYSAVWLVYGLAVLASGVSLSSIKLRSIAAALIVLVVAKVFLLDTSELTGALRALSFIGLGAVLVAVGLAYQKFLRR